MPYFQMSPINSSMSWNDLSWLQSITRLPIILKGILTKEDAELAVKHNVNGIIVSNHGGRQLDDVPASVSRITSEASVGVGRPQQGTLKFGLCPCLPYYSCRYIPVNCKDFSSLTAYCLPSCF